VLEAEVVILRILYGGQGFHGSLQRLSDD